MESSQITESSNIKKSLKVTSLFGGVKIFGILISIVRNKCVALLIGPLGIGIVSLYSSTIRLIKSCTDFSIQVSAVRDVSVAYKTGDENKFNHTVALFSKIVWFTGLLGTLVCLLGAPVWSKFTFGDYNHSWGFLFLSIILLLNQLESGKSVLLQGTEHFKYLAYSGIIGNILGLFTTIPIYFIWGVDGIIPVLIITALTSFLLAYYYVTKIETGKASIPWIKAVKEGGGMLKQGFLLSINYLLSTLVFYILRIFISNNGGVEELGLYSASFAIVTTYVGMVFQSMSQEYYPRLSALSLDNNSMGKAIDDQIYLSLLILGPLIVLFLTFSDFLLELLYSSKFTGASLLMAISMFGILYQAPSWCMAFSMLAKGDNRTYLLFETIGKVVKLMADIGLYMLWGLTGLGISFVLSFIYYTIQCSVVCRYKYQYSMSRTNITLLLSYTVLGIICIFSFVFFPLIYRIVLGCIILIIITWYSYKKINKIIKVSDFIRKKILKK